MIATITFGDLVLLSSVSVVVGILGGMYLSWLVFIKK